VELASWRSREAALALGATDGSLLTRVRRLLRVTDDSGPRPIAGFAIVTLSMLACAGWVAVQTSSAIVASDARTPQSSANGSLVRNTDHFEIHYGPDLDLHAERVAREAERAYEQVSSDLRHNLAFRVPLVLFHTSSELQQSVQAGTLVQPHTASFTEPARDRILLAVDRPADQWYGLLTHEVAHVFLFDIVPGTATPRWLAEGLAEYQRGTWDPADLSALRDLIRANAIPKIRRLEDGVSTTDPRLLYSFGHAAFDFIESRWGKAGMRQFIFGLRQAAINGTDPYPKALQVTRDEFEQGFERYLRERFSAAADQSLSDRFDYRATLRVEGDITAINATPPAGLSCIELWIATEGSGRRRWGVECGDGALDALRVLRPGDRVILTGPPARPPATQRMVMLTLVRPSDGFTWRGRSG
jgi:hypothetical protein